MNSIYVDTYSGLNLDLTNFDATDITIEDIAHGLSKLCRYNGQIAHFYSVAEHCIILSRWMESEGYDKRTVTAAFLHDAGEAFMGDIIAPVKEHIPGIHEMEDRILDEIFKRFDVHPTEDDMNEIYFLDKCMRIDEVYHLRNSMPPHLFLDGRHQLNIKPQLW